MSEQLVNPKEYGLEPSQAEQIESVFLPVIQERENLAEKYTEIVKSEITTELTKSAKELRLRLVKVRTSTDKIHKDAKAFYLAGGRFVDAWKNRNVTVIEEMESRLFEIEDHFAKIDREKQEELKQSRLKILAEYCENPELYNVGLLSDDAFNSLVSGQKMIKEQKIEAERKAEQARIAKEQAVTLHNERKEQVLPYWAFIPIEKRSDDFSTFSDEEWKERLGWCISEKKKDDDAKEAQRVENVRLREEADQAEFNRKKLELELEQKAQAEIKRIQDEADKAEAERKQKEKADRKAKNAPDKSKLEMLANSFDSVEIPDVKGEDAKKIISDVKILVGKLTTFIREKSQDL